jgi:hypothetical protein
MALEAKDYSDTKPEQTHVLRRTFDRTTQGFGNLTAVLIVVTYAKNTQEAFEFVVKNPVLSVTFIFLFIGLFLYNLLRNFGIKFPNFLRKGAAKAKDEPHRGPPTSTSEGERNARGPSRKLTLWQWGTAVASSAALALIVYIYVSVFVTGIYYVVVASAPSKETAAQEVQSLNHFFAARGYPDLEASAHASTATGSPWFMISIRGWHTSEESAETTFRRAKEAMGTRMRSDAHIYCTNGVSPRRVIIGWLRRNVAWLRQAGD